MKKIEQPLLYRFIRLTSIIILLSGALGCQHMPQYALSEQMVNHYLHSENRRQIHYKNPEQKMNVDMSLDNVKVDIGRNLDNSINANCVANLLLHLPDRKKQLILKMELSGTPELKSEQRALYLDRVVIQDYQEIDGATDMDMKKIRPSLAQIMQDYFNKYPIYLADNSSFLEKEALNKASFNMEKGKLNFIL